MNSRPQAGEFYRHFKGNLYQVIAIATHSETGEEMVCYQALYGDFRMYVRPLDMFMSKVDKVKYPDAINEYRFEKVNFCGTSNIELSDNQDNLDTTNVTNITIETYEDSDSIKEKESLNHGEEQNEKLFGVNKKLIDFLDADTCKEKLIILNSMKNELDERIINSITMSLDMPEDEGDIYSQYENIVRCLQTRARYEGERL